MIAPKGSSKILMKPMEVKAEPVEKKKPE